MAAWVFTISKDRPQHWNYATEHGLWDTRRRPDVKSGDAVYFWQSGHGLVGRAIATSDLFEHSDPDGPWDDAATGGYAYRFHLRVDADTLTSDGSPRWSKIQEATGIRQSLNLAPFRVSKDADTWLENLFDRSTRASFWSEYAPSGPESGDPLSPPDLVSGGLPVVLDPETDERERAKVAIALRRGQSTFRNSLLDAYRRRCAITGWAVVEVLEAAHISPYRGQHTNRVQNGLLLRSDLHTLFDLHLLTVSGDDLRVQVAPGLREGPYGEHHDVALRRTSSPDLTPNRELLRRHNQACQAWYAS